ncbi:hypothetical protein KY333_03015 [Candidatus Woesearchaeota archaeon]|nr:hypothetical protein [Candidatus Woesearchaeota archaeon]MBW2994169.1 hypothetical protein [Candidatus Woesearchaeota archaeon]
MKILNKAVVSVFVKEGEDDEKIKSTLLSLIPLDLEKEKIDVQQKTIIGFEGKQIRTYKIELEKTRHTTAFINDFLTKLSKEQKQMLLEQVESRLDAHMHFFIRLDKDKLLNGKYEITDSGHCFHIKLHIAAFPSKRPIALNAIEKLLK